ncbi:MAG: PIF1 family DEAD/DEAH box helicase [Candidatus Andersenbacteria bacterium]
MTQREALQILKTGASVFLTGEPGSGKTHTVNAYIDYLKSAKVSVAVTASTGIAATHVGGMTIHSWSGIGIKRTLSSYDIDRIATNERVAKRILRTAVLIIDEVSMLDGRVLESVDRVCREVKQSQEPFGGMQVVFVGDFFQLPPVSRDGDGPLQFAFSSTAWANLRLVTCYLSEQYRQADQDFLEVLSALRANAVTPQHRAHLDSRCVETAATMTRLFSHNVDVDRINEQELEKIDAKAVVFHMKTRGKKALVEQLQRGCLSPERLALKKGAVVMFTKNSPKSAFVNGTLGTVVDFHEDTRLPIVEVKSGRRIQTEPMEWVVEDNGRALARIVQIPLRLAWAITVHKSQGMSLDAAFVDLRQAFVEGQGYVALSRVRSLAGLFLAGYNSQALAVHPEVLAIDSEFRQQSTDIAAAFQKLSPKELQTLHRNFIKAAGGQEPPKTSSVTDRREARSNAYRRWEEEDDVLLADLHKAGESVQAISERFERQPGSIRSRLRKNGLIA